MVCFVLIFVMTLQLCHGREKEKGVDCEKKEAKEEREKERADKDKQKMM